MALALIQGAALLLALCFMQSVITRLPARHARWRQVLSGLLFGGICIVGMVKPLQFAPGVIFDARSVVLSMAALFGGWMPAAIATAMAALTRLLLGGGGVVIGLLVILASSTLGLLYRRARERGYVAVSLGRLLLFGLLVHAVALLLFQALESATVAHINRDLALPYLLVFGPATALLGWLLGDIEQRLVTETSLAETAARLKAVTASAPDLLMLLDADGTYLEVMSRDTSLATSPPAQLQGRNIDDELPPELARRAHAAIALCLQTGEAQTLQYELQTPLGLRHFESRCQPVGVPVQGRKAVVFIARDRTAQVQAEIRLRQSEEQARYLAYYDALSGLPNRRLLADRVHQVILDCRRNPSCAALFFIDLDHFKTLNDSRGHEAGDLVLKQAAERLRTSVREQDTVARLGGDEFVVLLPHVCATSAQAPAVLRPLAEKLLHALRAPYVLAGEEQHLTASLGIALIDGDTANADELLKHADLAMYHAKDEGRNTLRFFDPHMQAVANERAHLQTRLHQALRLGQFELYYQPQVNEVGHIIGAEALLRWNDPIDGLIAPGQFIPLAEETGQIIELGQWVLQEALARQVQWKAHPHLNSLSLSVNISAKQFHHEGFAEELAALLAQTGADPGLLRLELTESVLLANVDGVIRMMQQLRSLGLWLSLDDFGTGYSSLGFLKRLPLTEIKIDQGFVRGMLDNPTDAAIAQSIIMLADSLRLNVVAEGVETQAHHGLLLSHGCRKFQGYLFGRPEPLASFEARVLAQV